jgi:cytochrome c553
MRRTMACIALALSAPIAWSQDGARGARLFAETAAVVGAPVAACRGCHGDAGALRAMLSNRGVKVDDAAALARWLQAVIDGAQPGAANAKAQYRGVLKAQDVRDLAAYLAAARAARSQVQDLARIQDVQGIERALDARHQIHGVGTQLLD